MTTWRRSTPGPARPAWLFACLCASALGCSAVDNNTVWVEGDAGPGPNDSPPAPPPTPPYDEHRAERAAERCEFRPGQLTRDTIGPDAPRPPDDFHVIVLMLENRSFDHYFAGLEGADTHTGDGNPDVTADGGLAFQTHAATHCLKDVKHEWGASHLAYNEGRMDGFVALNNPDGARAMTYYTKADLPFAHWLAEHFAASDHHFGSMLGPTWPNRLFLFRATSCGYTEGAKSNFRVRASCGQLEPSLLSAMDDAGIGYGIYDQSGLASVTFGLGLGDGAPDTIADFEQHVKDDALPAVSFVGANTNYFTRDTLHGLVGLASPISVQSDVQNDDHPKANIQRGQLFMHRIVETLMANPAVFLKTILFITYDEGGGFYDHVPPPAACEPEADDGVRHDYRFDRLGFRVPLIVVSPYVKHAGYMSKFVTGHASITRFIEHWLDLPALSRRDANAWPMLDLFDFEREPIVPTLPEPPSVVEDCP